MARLKNERWEAFCREYLVDLNASAAYVRAGYSPKGKNVSSSKLLAKPSIQQRIRELRQPIEERLEADAESVTKHWLDIARADPNDLTALVRGACRHCHGVGHAHQYRIEAEYQNDLNAWQMLPDAKRVLFPRPSDEGGYGFSPKRDPHPECPMCDGEGTVRLRLGDTTKLPPEARKLFAGVKQTKDGLEVKFHDQAHALDQLARRLNLFADDNKDAGATDLAAALLQINGKGSAAPIQRDDPDHTPTSAKDDA